jgi:hypothetical protein
MANNDVTLSLPHSKKQPVKPGIIKKLAQVISKFIPLKTNSTKGYLIKENDQIV